MMEDSERFTAYRFYDAHGFCAPNAVSMPPPHAVPVPVAANYFSYTGAGQIPVGSNTVTNSTGTHRRYR